MSNLRWLVFLAGCMLAAAAVLGGLAVITSGMKAVLWSVPLGALIGFGLGVGIEQNFRAHN